MQEPTPKNSDPRPLLTDVAEGEEDLAAEAAREGASGLVIQLTVENHAGVMSHITGLFARRAFNLEGILCAPMGDGVRSRMYLLVNERPRISQLLRQLEKLHDVLEVSLRYDFDTSLFARLHEMAEERASLRG